jgi:hypothetical protein
VVEFLHLGLIVGPQLLVDPRPTEHRPELGPRARVEDTRAFAPVAIQMHDWLSRAGTTGSSRTGPLIAYASSKNHHANIDRVWPRVESRLA